MNNLIAEFLAKVRSIKVTILGETIVDEYRWVNLLGSTGSKSKCPSVQVKKIEKYQGGAAYGKRIVSNFVDDVIFITGFPITKIRYTASDFDTKYLEILEGECKFLQIKDIEKQIDECDLLIVADFGHGLISQGVANWKKATIHRV